MRITIAAVGRMRAGPERDHFQHYTGRIRDWPLEIREIDLRRSGLEASKRRAEEADALLRATPKNAIIVPLDEQGRQIGSAGLAKTLGTWQNEGETDIAFILGGADGLDQSVNKKGRLALSLGSYTWPHMLARIMLAEQIYRAQQILNNHPYHRA